MDKQNKTLLIYIGAIILSCIFDIATFLYAGFKYNLFEFEINPLILAMKGSLGFFWAISIVIIAKLLINFSFISMLYSYKPKKTHVWAFILTYGSLLLILLQFIGAWSNMSIANVAATQPIGSYEPVSPQEGYAIYRIVSLIYYFFLFLSIVAFTIYEKIFLYPALEKTKLKQ